MSAIKYRPEVDGLRAVAVLPVVLFHLGLPWIPGGFVGVDVFFVISGFLITSIILKEQAAGTFTFPSFWMRRVRRILPAMLTMLIATSVAGYFLMYGPSWKELGDQAIAAICLYANIEMWQLSGDYWGPAAENAPLLHTWSLSVEEQFYVFYPLLLLILLKFTPRRVFPTILGGSILSLAIGVYATTYHPNTAFYLLPARAWELAAGCLLAIFESSRGPAPKGNISRTLAFAGLLLIGAGYYLIDGSGGFPGFWALLPVVGTVLVIRFSSGEKCLAGGVLSWAPVVYLGKCSYSLYLWHWPVIVFAGALELKHPGQVNLLGILATFTIMTLVSYHFVEKPTRKMVQIAPLVIGLLIVSLGLATYLRKAEYSYDLSLFAPTESFAALYDVAPAPLKAAENTDGVIRQAQDPSQYSAHASQGIIRMFGSDDPSVVVLGSSHGLMWGRTIEEICRELELTVSFYTARATPPWIEFPVAEKSSSVFTAKQKFAFDTKRLEYIKAWNPDLVILIDRWSSRGDPFEYVEFLKYLDSCGTEVILVGQAPEIPTVGMNVPLYVAYLYSETEAGRGEQFSLEAYRKTEVDLANARIEELAGILDFCHYLPVNDFFELSQHRVLVRDKDEILYLDEDHLSQAGVQRAKQRIMQKITEIIQ